MLDNVIKMNLALFGVVCMVAFLVLLAIIAAACIELSQKYMHAHIPIFIFAVVFIELFIFGLCFAEYLMGR